MIIVQMFGLSKWTQWIFLNDWGWPQEFVRNHTVSCNNMKEMGSEFVFFISRIRSFIPSFWYRFKHQHRKIRNLVSKTDSHRREGRI